METNNYQKKIEKVRKTSRRLMPKLPYHNYEHALGVSSAASRLAHMNRVEYEKKFLLKTAALLHDIVMVPDAKDNEEKSMEFASQYLPELGYSAEQIREVGELILATKMPQKPKNLLEGIICDADLDNLGRPDFFEQGEKLRIEFGQQNNLEWYNRQLGFLKGHEYHTEAAKKLRSYGKMENIRKLEKMVGGQKC